MAFNRIGKSQPIRQRENKSRTIPLVFTVLVQCPCQVENYARCGADLGLWVWELGLVLLVGFSRAQLMAPPRCFTHFHIVDLTDCSTPQRHVCTRMSGLSSPRSSCVGWSTHQKHLCSPVPGAICPGFWSSSL